MRRRIAVLWHASFLIIAGVLYFYFVLPRYSELTGAWPVGLGNAMRIVCGALIGLAALPVLFTLLRTRKPEFGTPQLALTLRLWSVVLHVLAGALIVGAAVSEFWVTLDQAGAILFGIYGAAAALALLGALGFYLAFTAELPSPPPKPLKPKRERRGATPAPDDEVSEDADEVSEEAVGTDKPEASEEAEEDQTAEDEEIPTPVSGEVTEASEPAFVDETVDETADESADESADEGAPGRLKNRRPNGKASSRLFGRSRR